MASINDLVSFLKALGEDTQRVGGVAYSPPALLRVLQENVPVISAQPPQPPKKDVVENVVAKPSEPTLPSPAPKEPEKVANVEPQKA